MRVIHRATPNHALTAGKTSASRSRLSTGAQGDLQERITYQLPKEDLRLTSPFPVILPSAVPAGCFFTFTYFVLVWLVRLLSGFVVVAFRTWTGIQKKHPQIIPTPDLQGVHLPFLFFKNDTPLFKHLFFFPHLRLTRHNCPFPSSTVKILSQLAARPNSQFSFKVDDALSTEKVTQLSLLQSCPKCTGSTQLPKAAIKFSHLTLQAAAET